MSIFESRAIVIAFLSVYLTSCATISPHEFAEPARDWQVRSGQLLYRNPKRTLIGEVYVRFSKTGDLELTFSKGPGITLLVLHQDASFAELKGPLAGRGWSGPIDRAPQQLRGWLGLRDKLINTQNRRSIRYSMRAEEFLFQF
jgi:hypothetical protein